MQQHLSRQKIVNSYSFSCVKSVLIGIPGHRVAILVTLPCLTRFNINKFRCSRD